MRRMRYSSGLRRFQDENSLGINSTYSDLANQSPYEQASGLEKINSQFPANADRILKGKLPKINKNIGQTKDLLKSKVPPGFSEEDPLGILSTADMKIGGTGDTTIGVTNFWDKERLDALSNSMNMFLKGISLAGGKGLLNRR